MLKRYVPDDLSLQAVLGSSHLRFELMRAAAEAPARAFYRDRLGEELGIDEVIQRIFNDVDQDGAQAVSDWVEKLDHTKVEIKPIAKEVCAAAWETSDTDFKNAITTAIHNVETYQKKLLPQSFGVEEGILGVRWSALDRVGAYVPGGAGGSVPLVSTVIMNLVPARVAGVRDLVMVTPPRADGTPAPELLAAAHAVGVDEVYAIGGIPAIAALACGADPLQRVDKIVGPGNLFVTLAKRYAYGRVDIDMLAGPSEVLVISDGSVDPAWIAADLLSQAEHDPLAMSILLSIADDQHVDAIDAELRKQLDALPDANQKTARASIENHGHCIICTNLKEACELSNRIAPEHLEILVENPNQALPFLRHAGAIFIGPWSAEPIGDYVAGPSHTLPTGGSARMWSGIGADTFLRRTSLIRYDQATFMKHVDAGIVLAEHEGLEAHARSLRIRKASFKK